MHADDDVLPLYCSHERETSVPVQVANANAVGMLMKKASAPSTFNLGLSPYTAVKFFNRVKFKNRTAVYKGCLLGYKRLLQGPSTLSKLLVSNQNVRE